MEKANPALTSVDPLGDARFSVLEASTLRKIADMLDAVSAPDNDQTPMGVFYGSPIEVRAEGDYRLGYLRYRDDFWAFVPDIGDSS